MIPGGQVTNLLNIRSEICRRSLISLFSSILLQCQKTLKYCEDMGAKSVWLTYQNHLSEKFTKKLSVVSFVEMWSFQCIILVLKAQWINLIN